MSILDTDPGINLPNTCMACPEQYQGTVDGNPAYFRLRHSVWRFVIVKPGVNPVRPAADEDILFYKDGEYEPGQDSGIMKDGAEFIYDMIQEFRKSTGKTNVKDEAMELKAEHADMFKAVLEQIAAAPQFHEGNGGCHGFCPVCAAKQALGNLENRKYLRMEVYTKGWDDGYEEGVKRGMEIQKNVEEKKERECECRNRRA